MLWVLDDPSGHGLFSVNSEGFNVPLSGKHLFGSLHHSSIHTLDLGDSLYAINLITPPYDIYMTVT